MPGYVGMFASGSLPKKTPLCAVACQHIIAEIFNKNNGRIIYDNQPGDSDAELPVQAVGTNSTIVIKGTGTNPPPISYQKPGAESDVPVIDVLDVLGYPNPSPVGFNVMVTSNSTKERIVMQVIDVNGRVIENRNVTAGSIIRFGEKYRAGTYLIRVIQGSLHKELKLVKTN